MTLDNYTPFPGDSALIMGVLVADCIQSSSPSRSSHLSDHIRQLSDDDLKVLTVHVIDTESMALSLTNAIEAEYDIPFTKDTWWMTTVMPLIKKEVTRRNKPATPVKANNPIARMKSLDLGMVAGQFTKLIPAGTGKLKGCCPIHQEKSPSFYINQDKQTWHCFGACGTGGDVVTLLKAIKAKESQS